MPLFVLLTSEQIYLKYKLNIYLRLRSKYSKPTIDTREELDILNLIETEAE